MRLFLFLVLLPQVASASVTFFGNTSNDRTVQTSIASDEGLSTGTFSHPEGHYLESVSLKLKPVSLSILIDSSRMCAIRKLDTALLAKIQKLDWHPDSRINVIAYDSEGVQLLQRNGKPEELSRLNFNCRMEAQSASIESAVELLLSQGEISSNHIFWVFSSGHTQLGPKSRDAFSKHSTRYVLYNPLVEADVRKNLTPLLSGFEFSLIASAHMPLVQYYTTQFCPPRSLHGKTNRFLFSYADAEGKKRNALLDIAVPYLDFNYGGFLLKAALWLAFTLLFAYLLYRVLKFYLPKKCPLCKRLVLTSCIGCAPPQAGFLVGKTNYRDPLKWKKQDVVEIGSRLTIGTRPSCRVRVPRTKGMGRGKFMEIKRETLPSGEVRYMLVPLRSAARYRMELNQLPVTHATSLTDGDLIKLNGMEMSFLMKGNHHV